MDTPEQSTQNIPESKPSSYMAYEEEESISLLDILLVIARNKRIIGITAGVFLVIGLLIAVLSPNDYTSTARMIRETQNESASGLGSGLAALRGLGISIGGGSVGLTAETYPDILMSREVRLAVARSEFLFTDLNEAMTLVDYYSRPPGVFKWVLAGLKKVTIGLPGTLLKLFKGEPSFAASTTNPNLLVPMTEGEEDAIEALDDWVSVSVDRNTGIMDIAVTTRNPLLSAQVASTFIEHLMERVQAIYTQKSRENLEFIQERFVEARGELEVAEEALAQFSDRNQDIRSAKLATERDRLQRQVSFKTQLSSDLQTQLTQAEIEFQRSQPVITLLEAPIIPLKKSGPNRKLMVILGLFLGLGLGLGFAYTKTYLGQLKNDTANESKLEEIRKALKLGHLIKFKRQRPR